MKVDSSKPYRPGAGIVVVDDDGRVLVGRRVRRVGAEVWQFPQGGLDPGETPLEGALRELEEEIGTRDVDVIGELGEPVRYDLPPDLADPPKWAKRYRGQEQHWFAVRLRGGEASIDLATAHPEFDAYRWVTLDEAVAGAVPFKRAIYEQVASGFRHLARPLADRDRS